MLQILYTLKWDTDILNIKTRQWDLTFLAMEGKLFLLQSSPTLECFVLKSTNQGSQTSGGSKEGSLAPPYF